MKLSERLEAAREALDSMDDFARMEVSIDPIGPRKVLADFIEAAAELARRVKDAPTVCVGLSAVVGVGWQIYGTDGDNIESLPFDGGQRVRLVPEDGPGDGDYWGAKPQDGETDWTGYDG